MGETSYVSPIESKVDRLNAVWTISENFSDIEIETIIRAGNDWNEFTGGRVNLSFKIGTVETNSPWTIAREVIEGKSANTYINDSGEAAIILDADTYSGQCEGKLYNVVAHEFGHTFGIYEHGDNGVMASGKAKCDMKLNESDLGMFEEVNP